MTQYESVLRQYMDERGVKSIAELHRLVLADGVSTVSYERVRGALKRSWKARGRDPQLNLAIARALGLSEPEKARMAMASLGLL